MIHPKISVITIVLNGEKHIERCINSIINQGYPNLEYIVIDGGSTDTTLEIIDRYKAHIQKFKSEKDNGISDAFNKGIQWAEGEIIGIINADDWLEEGILLKISSLFLDHTEILYGKINQCFDNERLVTDADHHLLPKRMTLNHPAVFVRNHVYRKIGQFNVGFKIAMDYEWLLRCYTRGVQFTYANLIMVNMEMSGVSMKHWKKGIEEVRLAKKMHLKQPLKTELEYYFQICFTYLSLKIQASPFKSLFHYYRMKISPIQKQKAFTAI